LLTMRRLRRGFFVATQLGLLGSDQQVDWLGETYRQLLSVLCHFEPLEDAWLNRRRTTGPDAA